MSTGVLPFCRPSRTPTWMLEDPWDPYAVVESSPETIVMLVDGPAMDGKTARGLTHFSSGVIEIQDDMDPDDERCTLAHELIHVERGPELKFLTVREEHLVNVEASRRLIPLWLLWIALRDYEEHDRAAACGVRESFFELRMKNLTEEEAAQLRAWMGDHVKVMT